MRTLCKTLFAALALFSVLPSALAQTTCTEQDLSQVITCLNTDNLPTCLAQNPGCTDDDLDMQIAADELGNRVFLGAAGRIQRIRGFRASPKQRILSRQPQ